MSSTSSLRSISPGQSTGRRRSARSANFARGLAFVSAILSALCAGSVTVFSLYGHIFQERLHYSQFQVNGVAIAASIACYLPVPLLGYMCDRTGPAPLSLLAAILFALGYGMAATLYKEAATVAGSVGHGNKGPSTWAYACMLAAFISIGVATCGMYLSAVATCAKNFGRGRHRGLALAMPIAAYGLSGMWQSQVGSRVLYERLPPLPGGDGKPGHGDVDVFAFFLFLAVLLFVVGIIGTFTLRVVDEDELINEAVNELERSGLLNGSSLFPPSAPSAPSALANSTAQLGPGVGGSGAGANGSNGGSNGYGTMSRSNPYGQHTDSQTSDEALAAERRRVLRHRLGTDVDDDEDDALAQRLLDPRKNDEDEANIDGESAGIYDDEDETEAQAQFKKKQWVLNAETRRFLSDHTMWLFAVGFFFMIGPGEAFINNLGTVIQTLYSPTMRIINVTGGTAPTSPATQVSIVGITSTVARLLTGSLTDLLAPQPHTQYLQVAAHHNSGPHTLSPSSSRPLSHASTSSFSSEDSSLSGFVTDPTGQHYVSHHHHRRLAVSRVSFLLFFALVMSAGLVLLASGLVQNHGERFWIVSGLVGAGYGAVFSLTPIIITVIWGVENFGTNWGIVAMFPALGATMWGLIYSAVYQAGMHAGDGDSLVGGGGSGSGDGQSDSPDSNLCYGVQCYAPTFWAMAVSVWVACGLVMLAWKGRHGWAHRKIVI